MVKPTAAHAAVRHLFFFSLPIEAVNVPLILDRSIRGGFTDKFRV